MRHFMTYEFIYEFMYMKNIVKSYLNSGVSRFQMTITVVPQKARKAKVGYSSKSNAVAADRSSPCRANRSAAAAE